MTGGRTVIANITLTLDGHTTGPGGPYDMSCIAPHGVSEQARDALISMTTAPTVLLGRKNYEGFGFYWPAVADDSAAEPRDRRFAQWLNEVEKVVCSTTLTDVTWQNARLASGGPVEVVRKLRAQGEGDIRVLSSQSLIRQLLVAQEIDRLEITLAPAVVAGGDRLFAGDSVASNWQLDSSQATDSGAVRLSYSLMRERN
jgi:dihydrofolate reductase